MLIILKHYIALMDNINRDLYSTMPNKFFEIKKRDGSAQSREAPSRRSKDLTSFEFICQYLNQSYLSF